MNSLMNSRVGSIPIAFNPGANHSPAPAIGGAPKPSAAQDRLIVGVDFGTTYSGAFCVV